MASVAFHHFNQFQAEGKVKLFQGYGGYANGEQRRDFVSVEDGQNEPVFLDNPDKSGIFNLGTGRAELLMTWLLLRLMPVVVWARSV